MFKGYQLGIDCASICKFVTKRVRRLHANTAHAIIFGRVRRFHIIINTNTNTHARQGSHYKFSLSLHDGYITDARNMSKNTYRRSASQIWLNLALEKHFPIPTPGLLKRDTVVI